MALRGGAETLPVDERALPSRVVSHQHDGDLLPGRQQGHANGLGHGDEA